MLVIVGLYLGYSPEAGTQLFPLKFLIWKPGVRTPEAPLAEGVLDPLRSNDKVPCQISGVVA